MKAGSLQNLIADRSADSVKPEIGVGVTMVSWTDRHAGTIVEVSKSGHLIVVQHDTATRIDGNGMSDAQSYSFTPNPDGLRREYTRRKDGTYRQKGGQGRLLIGVRSQYHDYSF